MREVLLLLISDFGYNSDVCNRFRYYVSILIFRSSAHRSYGIEKDSVNFIVHHKWCIMCCKTQHQVTKSQMVKMELEMRLNKYDAQVEKLAKAEAKVAERTAQDEAMKEDASEGSLSVRSDSSDGY